MRAFLIATGILTIVAGGLLPLVSLANRHLPMWVFIVGMVILIVIGGLLINMAQMRPEPRILKKASRFPCPVCGGNNFTWGKAQGYYYLSFAAPKSKSAAIEARRCNRCGGIALFTVLPEENSTINDL